MLDKDLLLQHCHFLFACYSSGALLLIRENYELLVSNCSFINCNSGSAGGAVHSSLLNSRMVFEECTFYQSGARLYGKLSWRAVSN